MIIAAAAAEAAEAGRETGRNGSAVNGAGAVPVPSPRRPRDNHGHAEVATMSGPSGGPAPRRVNQAAVRALPAQRTSPGPVSPAPAGFDYPLPVEDPPRSRLGRPTMVAAALTAVAILGAGGIVAGYLIQRDDPTAPAGLPAVSSVAAPASSATAPRVPAVGGFTPAACSGPVPSNASRTPQKNAARGVGGLALYAGWSFFSDGSGFHMPVPDRWTYQKFGTTYCFHDPDGGRTMILDVGRKPTADPVTACKTEAKRVVANGVLPDYKLVTIEPLLLLDKAADWEYTYSAPDGTPMYVQTRWQATKGKAFAIAWATRQADWSGDFAKFSMALSSIYVTGK
jgi:hypothetical protein